MSDYVVTVKAVWFQSFLVKANSLKDAIDRVKRGECQESTIKWRDDPLTVVSARKDDDVTATDPSLLHHTKGVRKYD